MKNTSSTTDDIMKGSLLGLGAVTAATPFLNWNNHVSAGKPFLSFNEIKRASSKMAIATHLYGGWRAYALGVVPSATIAVSSDAALHRLFGIRSDMETPLQRISIAATAGAISGAMTALPEGIAQAQQLSPQRQSMRNMIEQIWRLNGAAALTRGTGAIMAREGLYVAGYYALTPLLVERFMAYTANRTQAELGAAIAAGGTVGFLTTPIHCHLRFHRQKSMVSTEKAPSYLAISQQIYREAAAQGRGFGAAFFKNAMPRSITTVVATMAMFKGNQLYEAVQAERATPAPR